MAVLVLCAQDVSYDTFDFGWPLWVIRSLFTFMITSFLRLSVYMNGV